MIDAPGPWGTGPFVLAEGHSVIDAEQATIGREPFACTWLWREDRTPTVRLVANTNYWDKRRGPHLREVVFRNDLSRERALELVCTTEGEVDILTEVSPADAERVERSEHARLVSIDAMRTVAGVINRDAEGLPLGDRRARRALNLAVDREGLVRGAMLGRARPLASLTPRRRSPSRTGSPTVSSPIPTTPPVRPNCGGRRAAKWAATTPPAARFASPLPRSSSAWRAGSPPIYGRL